MRTLLFLLLGPLSIALSAQSSQAVLVETESFQQKGGWFIDQQSMDVMGSPYLLAHGMGRPVADAETTVAFPETGNYRLFVRTRNWTKAWSEVPAGRFQVVVGGAVIEKEFGTQGSDWEWVDGGEVTINESNTQVALRDLTGFNGRCDALYFTKRRVMFRPTTWKRLMDCGPNYSAWERSSKNRSTTL